MRLPDIVAESLSDVRDERRLERAGRDNDLVGGDRPAVDFKDEPTFLGSKSAHVAIQLNREFERLGVALQIGDDLIARRIAAPGGRDGIAALEDDEAMALPDEVISHCQAGLAATNDCDLEMLA
jgi:hypothetical protein